MSDFGIPFLMECGSPEACAELCRELRLDFVELNISFPACQLEALTPERLRGLSAKYGVYFTLHMDEQADPFAFNRNVRQAWLDTFRQAFSLAKAAGIPVINMHMPKGIYITLDGDKHYMFAKYRQDYLARVEELRTLCQQELGDTDIRVCIENTDGWQPHEQEAVALLLQSQVIGLTLDIGHDHAIGEADLPFYQAHIDRLCHMHAHDCEGKRPHLALGKGTIDLPQKLGLAVANNARILLEIKTVASLLDSCASLRRYAPTTAQLAETMHSRPVTVTIDRPLGRPHPRKPNLIYSCNYGFVKGLLAPDGGWQDVYVLGVDKPLTTFTGRIIAVVTRDDDVEDKWIAVPEGVTFTAEEIMAQVSFVERFFQSHVHMLN